MRRGKFLIAIVSAAVGLFGALGVAHVKESSFAQIELGKYLVDAGDCIACHTTKGGPPFAGGRRIDTPFGAIYSANLTPDRDTGIGAWSDEDFYNALHSGLRPNGERLYPAFPYPYFTKMTRDDVMAVRAYLATLDPVHNVPPPSDLTWPLNYRFAMRGWDLLYFEPGAFKPNPDKGDEWNRGAYLVEGPGHCGACHTPSNTAGAPKADQSYQGNLIQGWFAPELANDPQAGLGKWTKEDVVEFLKTGRNRFTGAAGLMAEVVEHSTSKLTEADLAAIATYLKDQPAAVKDTIEKQDASAMTAGEAIYKDSCAACHGETGQGQERMFPRLRNDAELQQRDPTTVIRVILLGARTAVTAQEPTPSSMPSYAWKLNDEEVAAVATYVRNAWGNSASPVSSEEVSALRGTLLAALRGPPGVKE